MNILSLNKYLVYLMLFMGIFNFYIPKVGPALYISLMLSFVIIILNIRNASILWSVISSSYALFITKFCFPLGFVIALATVRTISEGAVDITFAVMLIKILLFSIVASLFTICIFITSDIKTLSDINKYIYKITLLQSIIIITAILFPTFADIIKSLQNNESNNSSLVTEGLRGVALSSMQFYALACYFCVVLVLLADDFTKKKVSLLYTCVLLLFISAASIFISRTAILGVVIFFLYIFNPFSRFSKLRSLQLLFIFITIGVLMLLFSYALFPTQLSIIQEKVLPWAFEIIYKYNDTGGVSTASTDELRGMYFPLQENTFIFGDGRYAGDIDGTYYMGTDAGYMRPTLFGGIFLISAMLFVWINWLRRICNIVKSKTLFMALLLLSLALQYKGEFIISNYCTTMVMVVLVMASLMLQYNKRKVSNEA